MENEPLVTVLMPAYNAQRYIKTAIESILGQTYKNFEYLIIDDGSDDKTGEIIKSFHDSRILYVRNETNLGLVKILNEGLTIAKGDLVARQDADDISYPKRLDKQVAYMVEHNEVALLGTQGRVIDENGNQVYVGFYDRPQNHLGIRWSLCFDNAFIHTSVIFRKKIILDQFKGYREFTSLKSKSPAQDFELWSRVSRNQKTANLSDVLVECREHLQSISSSLKGKKGRVAQTGNIKILTSNITDIFGLNTFSNSQIKLISKFRYGIPESDHQRFLITYDDMFRKYNERFTEAKREVDIKRIASMQLANLAYSYLAKSDFAAVRVYARSAMYYTRTAFRWPWAKIILLLLFGARAREIYRRLRKYCG